MGVQGCVHFFARASEVEELTLAIGSSGWISRSYSEHGQTWQPASDNLPECLVVDLDLVSLETLARYCSTPVTPPIVTIANPANLTAAVESMRYGAWYMFLKPIDVPHFIKAISTAFEHDRQTTSSNDEWRRRYQSLSPREREVMQLLLEACNTTQIAHRLSINAKTVEKHRLHLLEKLNVQSVPELLRIVFLLRGRGLAAPGASCAACPSELIASPSKSKVAPIPQTPDLLAGSMVANG